MKRAFVAIGAAALVLALVPSSANAASDRQIRASLLSPAQMLRAAGTNAAMVRDTVDCDSNATTTGCVLGLKPPGTQKVVSGVALPWLSGVSVATTSAAAEKWLSEFKGESRVEGQSVEVSTPTRYAKTIHWYGNGYTSRSARIIGSTMIAVACYGANLSRTATIRCADRLLDAQVAKASSLS